MKVIPPGSRDEDEEPTDPMLEDPPGRAVKRPSLAPSLSMRISEAPRGDGELARPAPRMLWVFAGGGLIILALLVLIMTQLASRTETVPVVAVPAPVPIPDPELGEVAPSIEPVPDPAPVEEVAPAPPTPTPAPEETAANEPGSSSDDEPTVADESPPEHLAVVVHPDNPVNEMTAEEIRHIYLEDRHFADGRVAKPVGRYQAPALRKVFLELVLGTNHVAIKKYWEDKKAEGLERVRRLPSDEDVIQFVSKRPDAIGYVDWAKLPPESREKVKLVFEIRLQ